MNTADREQIKRGVLALLAAARDVGAKPEIVRAVLREIMEDEPIVLVAYPSYGRSTITRVYTWHKTEIGHEQRLVASGAGYHEIIEEAVRKVRNEPR